MRKLTLLISFLTCGAAWTAERSVAEAVSGLEKAFTYTNARALTSVVSTDRKTYLSLPELYPEEGYFGAQQLYYIFHEIFSEVQTIKLEVEISNQAADAAHASLRWRYQHETERAPRETLLLATLGKTEAGFVLIDLRSGR